MNIKKLTSQVVKTDHQSERGEYLHRLTCNIEIGGVCSFK